MNRLSVISSSIWRGSTCSSAAIARKVAGSAGTVPAAVLEEVRAAGYSDAQVVDTLLTVAAITFTNLLNRVNDTVVDFPAVN